MAVPDFQSFFRPMLQALADGTPKSLSTLRHELRQSLGVSDQDFQEMLPSGVRTRFSDRVYWANTHLYQAGLIQRPANGVLSITDRGRSFLVAHQGKILASDLMQFAEYSAFRKKSAVAAADAKVPASAERTPQERIEEAYSELRATLARELLDKVVSASPAAFERLVIRLLLKMGYGGGESDASEHLGGSGDGGVDGVINQDTLGLDRVYVQAKRWKDSVGADRIYAFAGSLDARKASKGVIMTTSSFTEGARKATEAVGKRVVLIDGDELVRLMMDFGLGVRTVKEFSLLAPDADAFDEFES
jgi:restriction system protein